MKIETEEEMKAKKQKETELEEMNKFRIKSFFTKQKTITINKESEATLVINFLPFYTNNHRCTIILIDERVGEMEYQVIGRGLLPKPIDIAGMSRYLDKADPVLVSIPFENKQITAALEDHWRLCFVGRQREKDIYMKINKHSYEDGKTFNVSCDSRFLVTPQVYTAVDLNKEHPVL